MKLYADQSSHFFRQLLADFLVLLWVVAWIWIGHAVHDGTLALAEPGHRIQGSATNLGGSLRDAGGTLSHVPVVGSSVSEPFDRAAAAADSIASAGGSEVAAAEKLALWLGLSIALIPILVLLAVYLPGRVRFVRDAGAGQRFIDADPDLRLFALRAMTNQPMHVLARVSDDPVTAWQLNDRDVVRALAVLELDASGLVPPKA
jgi:hypothetical protein